MPGNEDIVRRRSFIVGRLRNGFADASHVKATPQSAQLTEGLLFFIDFAGQAMHRIHAGRRLWRPLQQFFGCKLVRNQDVGVAAFEGGADAVDFTGTAGEENAVFFTAQVVEGNADGAVVEFLTGDIAVFVKEARADIADGMALEVFFFPGIGIAEAEEEGVVADRADAEDGDIGVAAEFQDALDVAVAVDHFLDFLRIEEDRQGQVLGDSFVILGEFFQDFVGVRFTRRQGDAPFKLDDLGALQGVGDELVREAVQRRTPADADDVAVLDDFVDIGRAALADVFLHFFFVFNGRIGDADIAQAIGSGDFFCQLALVLDGIEDFDTDEAHVFSVLQES